MARGWEPWKAKSRLSTVPTHAWKSQNRRFPHSHRHRHLDVFQNKPVKSKGPPSGRMEKWKSKTRIPTFPPSRPGPAAQGKISSGFRLRHSIQTDTIKLAAHEPQPQYTVTHVLGINCLPMSPYEQQSLSDTEPRAHKELQAKMDPVSLADNKRRVREELRGNP